MRKLFVLILTVGMAFSQPLAAEVPRQVDFADLDLTLDSGARNYISNFIAKLQKSPAYFQKLAGLARTYMPLVDQAFGEVGTPADLKYIVLQESSLNGGAVSKSGAVGYWQIKEPAAREVGLEINRFVDERKHIYRSSVGAATYFKQINKDFDNWIFAVIGYNRGPAGALNHINKRHFGSKKLTLTQHTHVYALKAVAFKIAFEEEIKRENAPVRLELHPTGGETKVTKLAQKHRLSVDEFRDYNLWIKGNQLPAGGDFMVVVPRKEDLKPALVTTPPPVATVSNASPAPPSPSTVPVVRPDRQTGKFTYLTPQSDPDYGNDYVIVEPGQQLVEISVWQKVSLKKLHQFNGTKNTVPVPAGTMVYLRKPKRMDFHIARAGDSWASIGAQYQIPAAKLKQRNLTNRLGEKIWAGQKIYLGKKKPKGEKILILETEVVEIAGVELPEPVPARSKPKASEKKGSPANSQPEPRAVYQYHTVRAGETLWAISQKYETTVDKVKKLNGLGSNEIRLGQKLKVPQR